MTQQGKIDRVYEEIVKVEDQFRQLENDQQNHFEQYIEKASASIIAEVKKQISQLMEKIEKCECNQEILNLLTQEKGKRKIDEMKGDPNREILKLGWHPENLELEENSFYLKKK